jgi:hypothetical protein
MQHCKGKNKTGAACRAPASAGGLCFFHANPDSAKTLGQLGGRKNRRVAVDLEVPDNLSAADLRKVTAQAMRLLLSGELGAREASALAQLCNSAYRIIPTIDLENRVLMLEEQIAQEGQEAQEIAGIAPDVDSSGSTTDGTEVAETSVSVEAEQTADPINVIVEQEEGAEGESNGSGEAEEV